VAVYIFDLAVDFFTGIGTANIGGNAVTFDDNDKIRMISSVNYAHSGGYWDCQLTSRRMTINADVSIFGNSFTQAELTALGLGSQTVNAWQVPIRGDVHFPSVAGTNTATNVHTYLLPITDITNTIIHNKGFQAGNGGIAQCYYQWTTARGALRQWGLGVGANGNSSYGRMIRCVSAAAVASVAWGWYFEVTTGLLTVNIPGSGTTPPDSNSFTVGRGNSSALSLLTHGGTTRRNVTVADLWIVNADCGNLSGGGYGFCNNAGTAIDCSYLRLDQEGGNYHNGGFVQSDQTLRCRIRGCRVSSVTSNLAGGGTSLVIAGGNNGGGVYVEDCEVSENIINVDGGFLPDGTTHSPADTGGVLRSLTAFLTHSPTGNGGVKSVRCFKNKVYHDLSMYIPWGGPRSIGYYPALPMQGSQMLTPKGDPTIYENMRLQVEDNEFYGCLRMHFDAGAIGYRRNKVRDVVSGTFESGFSSADGSSENTSLSAFFFPFQGNGGFISPAGNAKNVVAVVEFNDILGSWRANTTRGFMAIGFGQQSVQGSVSTGDNYAGNNILTVQGNTIINNVASGNVSDCAMIGIPSGSPAAGSYHFMPAAMLIRDNIISYTNCASKTYFIYDLNSTLSVRNARGLFPSISGNWFCTVGHLTGWILFKSTTANLGTGDSAENNMNTPAKWANEIADTNYTPGSTNFFNVDPEFVNPNLDGQLEPTSPVRTTMGGQTALPDAPRLGGQAFTNAGAWGYSNTNGSYRKGSSSGRDGRGR